MKQWFDRFILKIPYSLLKKVLYIYIGAIIFWKTAPVVSMILWVIICIAMLVIGYQSAVRKSKLMKTHPSDRLNYVETMRAPPNYWAPRLLLVAVVAAVTGYFLNGQFGLSGMQIFLLIVGYVVIYRETNLLGAYAAYMISNRGIGIEYIPGHLVFHTFIPFDEIKSVNVIRNTQPSPAWSYLTPLEEEQNGLLLVAANPCGFTPREHDFFITPKDVRTFLSHLPASLPVVGASLL